MCHSCSYKACSLWNNLYQCRHKCHGTVYSQRILHLSVDNTRLPISLLIFSESTADILRTTRHHSSCIGSLSSPAAWRGLHRGFISSYIQRGIPRVCGLWNPWGSISPFLRVCHLRKREARPNSCPLVSRSRHSSCWQYQSNWNLAKTRYDNYWGRISQR